MLCAIVERSMLTYMTFLIVVSAPAIVYSIIRRRMLKQRFGYKLFPAYLLCVALGFLTLEIIAIRLGWWVIFPKNTLGISVFRAPIEELLFFILIPQICLLVWAVLRVNKPWQNIRTMALHHIRKNNE